MQKTKLLVYKLLGGLVFGLLLVFAFSAQAQAPTVVTNSSSLIERGDDAARLTGSATLTAEFPFGQVFFEYGRTSLYGSATSRESITSSASFSHDARGLNEDTGYHYRAVLLASDGTFYYGADKTFITKREADFPGYPSNSTGNEDDTGGGETAAVVTVVDENGEEWGSQDEDGDGITNEVECGVSGTQDCLDSDNDGDPDSDNDGIKDQNEAEGQRTTPTFPTAGGSGSDSGEGVTLGESDPLPPSGGGSLIPNGTGVPNSDGPNPQFNDTSGGIVPECEGSGCGFNDAIQLIQNIINWIVWFSVIVIVIGIVYAGFLYMTGSPDKIKQAKEMFRNMAIGMFFVLAGWLIVNTIIDKLVKDDFKNDAAVDLLE